MHLIQNYLILDWGQNSSIFYFLVWTPSPFLVIWVWIIVWVHTDPNPNLNLTLFSSKEKVWKFNEWEKKEAAMVRIIWLVPSSVLDWAHVIGSCHRVISLWKTGVGWRYSCTTQNNDYLSYFCYCFQSWSNLDPWQKDLVLPTFQPFPKRTRVRFLCFDYPCPCMLKSLYHYSNLTRCMKSIDKEAWKRGCF